MLSDLKSRIKETACAIVALNVNTVLIYNANFCVFSIETFSFSSAVILALRGDGGRMLWNMNKIRQTKGRAKAYCKLSIQFFVFGFINWNTSEIQYIHENWGGSVCG